MLSVATMLATCCQSSYVFYPQHTHNGDTLSWASRELFVAVFPFPSPVMIDGESAPVQWQ